MATGTSSTMPTHFIDNLRRHRLGQRLGSAPDGTDHATHLHRHSFEEVKKEFDLVPILPEASLVRQKYTNEYEVVVNEQIKWVGSLLLSFPTPNLNALFSYIHQR